MIIEGPKGIQWTFIFFHNKIELNDLDRFFFVVYPSLLFGTLNPTFQYGETI
jgi:hypothetical protein